MGKIERQELGSNLKGELDGYKSHLAEMATVERYGAHSTDEVGYETYDSTSAIKAAVAAGDVIHFINKNYKVTDEIKFRHGQTIFAPKGLVLDGTDFAGTNGDSVVKVTNTGDAYTALPPLTADIIARVITLTFSAPHGLKIGDIICLYDNTEYSWSSARSYYKKGEFCKVSSIISDTQILLDNEVFDTYNATTNANFGVYKMNMGTFNVIGGLKVIQGKSGNTYAIKFERVKDLCIDNIVGEANNGSYTAISLTQCYNPNIKAVATQEKLSGLGGDYGLALANCQKVLADGYFSASRHGVTTGGYDGIGSVITRNCHIRGIIATNELGDSEAANTHGNSEDITFEGTILGGISMGGSNIKVDGTIYANKKGTCVYMAEVRSFDYDLSGCKCISYGDPYTENAGRGVIDFGGGGVVETNYMLGGTLKLNNINIYAPNSMRGIVIRTRNTNVLSDVQKAIDMSNSNIITSSAAGSMAYYIADTSAAKNFDRVNAQGLNYNAENRTVNNTNIKLLEKQKGRNTYTTTTSVRFVTVAVTFSKPFPTGYVPAISANLENSAIGGYITGNVSAVTNTGFTFTVLTVDATNFGVAGTYNFSWTAE